MLQDADRVRVMPQVPNRLPVLWRERPQELQKLAEMFEGEGRFAHPHWTRFEKNLGACAQQGWKLWLCGADATDVKVASTVCC